MCLFHRVTAAIAVGKRPAPFRTRKLSPPAPMVLHPNQCGRVGHRRTQLEMAPEPSVRGPFRISRAAGSVGYSRGRRPERRHEPPKAAAGTRSGSRGCRLWFALPPWGRGVAFASSYRLLSVDSRCQLEWPRATCSGPFRISRGLPAARVQPGPSSVKAAVANRGGGRHRRRRPGVPPVVCTVAFGAGCRVCVVVPRRG